MTAAEDVIVDHHPIGHIPDIVGCSCGKEWDPHHVLEELRTAGYAVVELPEPRETVDGLQWPVKQHWGGGNPDRDGYVTIRRDGRISALSTGNPHDCSADARSLAAALLAAADAAEAS